MIDNLRSLDRCLSLGTPFVGISVPNDGLHAQLCLKPSSFYAALVCKLCSESVSSKIAGIATAVWSEKALQGSLVRELIRGHQAFQWTKYFESFYPCLLLGSSFGKSVAIKIYLRTHSVSQLAESLMNLLAFDDFGCVGLFGVILLLYNVSISRRNILPYFHT